MMTKQEIKQKFYERFYNSDARDYGFAHDKFEWLYHNITTNQPNGSNTVLAVSGPTDDEITLVISEIVNHYQSGLANSLHHQYYITKVRNLFQAAYATAKGGQPSEQLPCREGYRGALQLPPMF